MRLAIRSVDAVNTMCQPVRVTGYLKSYVANNVLLRRTMHTALNIDASIPMATSMRKRAISAADPGALMM